MGFLNQPQQDGPYRVDNSFQKGLQLDTPPDNTPPAVMTGGQNMHLLRQQGSEVLLATEPGMERRCLLPPNHVIHGFAQRSGILYLLLAELDGEGQATGRGQLGTFPSPQYGFVDGGGPEDESEAELIEQGLLTMNYRPLHVYYGDYNGVRPGPLESVEFNLSLDAPSELELQDSYDGTLNIIINDRGRNSALLVNSGFVMLPPTEDEVAGSPGRFRIVRREGDAQTNRYSRADFKSRLQLFPRGGSLAKAYLLDVVAGGRLLAGSYRYYFTYTDADGNDTDIFAEAGPVEVFEASSPAQAQGGRTGEATTLSVQLRLENLDETFGFVRVRYVRRSGEPEAFATAYELEQRFAIIQGACELTHTGQENEQGISAAQLQQAAGSLSTFVTMCQAGSRLLLGGVRQDAIDDELLLETARQMHLDHQIVSLPQVAGLDTGSTAGTLYQTVNKSTTTGAASGRTAYNDPRATWLGGYVNPLNSCYRLGYMRGESYAFGVRFILDDYSLTQTYPLTGADNLKSTADYNYLSSAGNPAVFDATGWSQSYLGDIAFNQLGIYRFPADSSLPGLVEENTNAVNIVAARVRLPEIPDALRQRTIGVQFMRAARRPDRITQGYLVPTLRGLQVEANEPYDHHHPDFKSVLQGTTASNLKVLPAVRGILETVDKDYANKQKAEQVGVFPFAFAERTNHPQAANVKLFDERRCALYAPDAIGRPQLYLPKLNERSISFDVVGLVKGKYAVGFDNKAGVDGGSISLYKTTQSAPFFGSQKDVSARAYWTLDNQSVVNGGQFGSQEKSLLGKHTNDQKFLVSLAWESYVGLHLQNIDAGLSTLLHAPGFAGKTGYELYSNKSGLLALPPQPIAYLVNVYNAGGIAGLPALKARYTPDALAYTPISQRLSWNELAEQTDSDGRIVLYGGDTYVGVSYRRVYRALPREQRREEKFDAALGQVLSLVCETEINPYTRSEEAPKGGVGAAPSFSPLIGAGKQNFAAFREENYYQQPESSRYNAGYTSENEKAPPLVSSGLRPMNIPYRAQEFMARVVTSAAAADGSFSNGYRFLPPLSFRDYERQLGRIMRLLPVAENQVLVVHEHGMELLGLNDQALTGQNTAGPVYAEAKDFLPAQGRIIDRHLGIQHPFAVCVTPQGVYGVDAAQGCTWFWPFGAGQVTRLSDFSVSTLLGPVLNTYKGKPTRLQQLDIRVSYDPLRADVLFSLYQKS